MGQFYILRLNQTIVQAIYDMEQAVRARVSVSHYSALSGPNCFSNCHTLPWKGRYPSFKKSPVQSGLFEMIFVAAGAADRGLNMV